MQRELKWRLLVPLLLQVPHAFLTEQEVRQDAKQQQAQVRAPPCFPRGDAPGFAGCCATAAPAAC